MASKPKISSDHIGKQIHKNNSVYKGKMKWKIKEFKGEKYLFNINRHATKHWLCQTSIFKLIIKFLKFEHKVFEHEVGQDSLKKKCMS